MAITAIVVVTTLCIAAFFITLFQPLNRTVPIYSIYEVKLGVTCFLCDKGSGSEEIEFTVADICDNIVVKRKHIDIGGEDKYGHWWIEMGDESYGWWPKEPVDLSGTIFGVEGVLNGQGYFQGSATQDYHHGDDADEEFNPTLSSSAPDGYSCEEAESCSRNFATSYSGSWSWPCGQNCHSFQTSLMATCNLE